MPRRLGSRIHPSAVAGALALAVLVTLGSATRFVDDPLFRSQATSSPTGSLAQPASSRAAARTATGVPSARLVVTALVGIGRVPLAEIAVGLPLLDRSLFVPPRG